MKQSLSPIAMMAALATDPAFAGNLAEPVPEPVITPVAPAGPDWTGFYIGSQVGYADAETNAAPFGGDDIIAGFTAGYDHDFGSLVAGGAIDHDWTHANLAAGNAELDNIFRAKLRGGFKLGNGLAYATGGYAQADTNLLGDDDGYFAGVGYDYLFSDQLSIGGEVLYHEFDNFNGTVLDAEVTTVQVRTVYRF